MTAEADEDFDLDGWAEIAGAIGKSGVDERTARRYANRADDPLPVYVGLGRVVARRSEVKAWVRRQLVARAERRAP